MGIVIPVQLLHAAREPARASSSRPWGIRFPVQPAILTHFACFAASLLLHTHPLSVLFTMSDKLVHLGDFHPRPGFWKAWERVKQRHGLWFAECFAEFVRFFRLSIDCVLKPCFQLGVFIYTFAGTGPTFVFNLSNITKINNIGCRYPLLSGHHHPDTHLIQLSSALASPMP